MNEMFKTLLSLSLAGTILIFILLLLYHLYKNRLSKRWQYYIWLVVIIRMLLPWTPGISHVEEVIQKTGLDNSMVVADTNTNINIDKPLPDAIYSGLQHPITRFMQFAQHILDAASPVIKNIHIIWLAVVLFLFTRKVTIYQSFVKHICASSVEVNDLILLEHFGHIMEQNHIRGTIRLYVSDVISSSMIIGFFHPCIVLTPSVLLSGKSFHYTVLHELVHYKRMDIFYKWLVQITLCLHWFNPFVYIMERRISQTCELSCDEMVIKKLNDTEKREYGDNLLYAVRTGGPYKNIPTSVNLNDSKELLKGRLESIMKYKEKSRLAKICTYVLTILLCASAASLSIYKTPATVSSSAKKEYAKHKKEYAKHGITKKNGAYYYKEKRVRIFMDLRDDGSFVCFNYDEKGTKDLYVRRAKDNSIARTGYITKKEAAVILNDMDIKTGSGYMITDITNNRKSAKPYVKVSRMSKKEVPGSVAKLIKSCRSNKWYIISENNCQYIYYNGLPRDYAFQPEISADKDNININISDIGKPAENYVLLVARQNKILNIYYNNEHVSCKKITANTN